MILHSDCNCFYASVEMCEHPELRGKRVAVCGSTEDRHGIVLTASYPAKHLGVRTGMANWQARQVCPDLIMVPPHYELYLQYSRAVRGIYRQYTDLIEPYGMDENWLGLPGREDLPGEGARLAETLRKRVLQEIGITVSVGVSFNKIFAKLGSDRKKPDGQTIITRENFREIVWPLPARELLWIGRATERKLLYRGVFTIGELANTPPARLRDWFGINGLMLWRYANGMDDAPVAPLGYEPDTLSVGHGTTCRRDLLTEEEVWPVLYELSQDVGHRLRAEHFLADGVQIAVRDCDLGWEQYQSPLPAPTRSPFELAQAGYALFRRRFHWVRPVRALTIRGIRLLPDNVPVQTDLFSRAEKREKRRQLDDAVDELRRRFGTNVVSPASLLGEIPLARDRCEIVPLPGMPMRQ